MSDADSDGVPCLLPRFSAPICEQASDVLDRQNAVFDESGNFLVYCTMLGVKVVNLETNSLSRVLGRDENVRFLQATMFQVQSRDTGEQRAACTVTLRHSCVASFNLVAAIHSWQLPCSHRRTSITSNLRMLERARTRPMSYGECPRHPASCMVARQGV